MLNLQKLTTVQFWIHLLIVGIATIIFGHIAKAILHYVTPHATPIECANWNENYIFEKTLFLTGVLAHFTVCVTGLGAMMK